MSGRPARPTLLLPPTPGDAALSRPRSRPALSPGAARAFGHSPRDGDPAPDARSGTSSPALPGRSARSREPSRRILPRRAGSGVTLLLVLAAPAAAPPAAAQDAAIRLDRLLERAWDAELAFSPLAATRRGDHRWDDRLPDVSEAAYEARLEELRGFLEEASRLDPEELPDADRTDLAIFQRLSRGEIQEYELGGHYMPFTTFVPFYSAFPDLADRMPLDDVEGYENYLARLRGFREMMEQYEGLMRSGMEKGVTIPRVVLDGVPAALRAHVVEDPEESRLWEPFRSFPEGIPEGDRERLRQEGREAVRTSIVPGYRGFLRFIEEEYVPDARETIGASALPDGEAFYAHRVREYTTLDVSPEEVHRRGLAEVERIRGEMEAVIREVGFEGSFADFLEFLRTDERFYADSPEELLRRTALVLKRMDGELPRLFRTLPRTPYGIRPIPDDMAPTMTTAYYSSPSGDGTRAGFYYVNTYDLPSRPLYEIQALSFHEAVPGHHLQNALQQELGEVRPFRRYAGFTAFGEGWALYAEGLGREVGFYEDPYDEFGRLTFQMWRALRLVVDTGIHAMGWSRERAIRTMEENSALARHNIEAEVDRYISWPGQALGYKMGELVIRDLRGMAEEALGSAFDVREFHDVVLLGGALPLELLEERVERWVVEEEARPAP